MAKKLDQVKPLFPLKHEFVASIDKFIHEATMLRDCARQLLEMSVITGNAAGIVKERIAAFDAAKFGEGQPD